MTVLVDPTNEVDALNRLSVSLREEIARSGLAIEIDPTSNLLIETLPTSATIHCGASPRHARGTTCRRWP